ncbi:MlaC/ttg2D family ABC transporter substrate-binding protein [Candidatus Methylopumilus rimovensis]|jgi:phospholipid transport system substrate-binding protein|uniref:ABC transporter substrate-binding protein n=1 Tax=Candidatus Methylopumilus rimovensis TaxID=2588535 RepID=A0AAE6FU93_9PROT|nr:ABC transporter substrate-binding protein [Candidatus Methylopumilus rimovensis]QDD12673.1 ABC transporter substrate-binding protein [Candidatus Methylopumilus rimovensis]QDD13976.1 ABC transporter substrate-binding protein [Candidatus Methylopumilus rimovensis]
MKKFLLLILTLLMSMSIFAAEAPDLFVRKIADEVFEILKTDKDLKAGNKEKAYKITEEKILPYFDFDRISKLVLGKAWPAATKDEQEAFKKEFRTMLVKTYGSALLKFKDQTLNYKPTRFQPSDEEVLVKTEILKSGAPPLPIDYMLEKDGDSWKVFDIIIEGVSLVTNFRGQFGNEIKQNGIASLISKLAEKNADSDKAKSNK